MNKVKQPLIILLLTICFIITPAVFLLPDIASAQTDLGLNYAENTGLTTPGGDIRDLLVRIIQYFLSFLGLIAVAVIIYGGFLWMTSAGRPDRLAKAKQVLINASAGLVIVVAAFFIVTFIVNLFDQGVGGGAGRGPGPGGQPTGIGALGTCAVESVYPAPGQEDVPRNTSIIVTFIEDVDPNDVCGAAACDGSTNVVPENVRIYRTGQGDSCEWDGSNWINCADTNLTDVSVSQAGRTFVFVPDELLGSPSGNIGYSVRLDQGIRGTDGRSIFEDCRTDNLIWDFSVSNKLDLVPPRVKSGGIFPPPDDDVDTLDSVAAVAAEGAVTVLQEPVAGRDAAASISGSSPGSGTVAVDPVNTETGTVWVTVQSDGITAQLSRDGGSPLLGSAVFSGQELVFAGYFSLTASNPVTAGDVWYIDLAGRRQADTLTVGPATYSFVESSPGENEIIADGTLNTALNINNKLNGDPEQVVDASVSGNRIDLTAVTAGRAGNGIVLSSNNGATFSFEAMDGGADAQTSIVPAGRPDPPRNAIVQVNFNETVNPAVISGEAAAVSDAIQVRCVSGPCTGAGITGCADCVDGEFVLSNQYRTVEFIPRSQCGSNTCGDPVYCLPSESNIEIWLHAATLKTCGDDSDCAAYGSYSQCLGNNCSNGTENYPLSELALLDGVMDAALNSLDGNRDADADGPVSDYNENSPVPTDGDNYRWSFWVSDFLDLTPPQITSAAPDLGAGNIELDVPVEIVFNKPMLSSSLKTGRSTFVQGGETITHYHINISNYANYPTGYWITKEDALDASGFLDYTTAYLNHTPFGPSITHRAQAGSGVRDIYQNCFRPAEGPACVMGTGDVSCCNGSPTTAETCP